MNLYLNGLGLAGGHPVTGAMSTDATPLGSTVTVSGADFVSLTTDPGSIDGVALLKVKLPAAVTSPPPFLLTEINVTIDGNKIRLPLAVPQK